jgi:hypothetical protein
MNGEVPRYGLIGPRCGNNPELDPDYPDQDPDWWDDRDQQDDLFELGFTDEDAA